MLCGCLLTVWLSRRNAQLIIWQCTGNALQWSWATWGRRSASGPPARDRIATQLAVWHLLGHSEAAHDKHRKMPRTWSEPCLMYINELWNCETLHWSWLTCKKAAGNEISIATQYTYSLYKFYVDIYVVDILIQIHLLPAHINRDNQSTLRLFDSDISNIHITYDKTKQQHGYPWYQYNNIVSTSHKYKHI